MPFGLFDPRHAKGKLSRDAFLQTSTDLGDSGDLPSQDPGGSR
ncbi:MAG TPA: hypothetical protein VE669_03515 [Actinomycetota bacterium]|jgi:hypothetical protein|nr:hypothetical protein [Actinomycetota bacterium]